MELPPVAALALAVLLGMLVLFQLALAAGAPWGRAAYGGLTDRPGPPLRITSVLAALIWSAAALVMLRRAGLDAWAPAPDPWLVVLAWIVAGLLAVSIIVNLLSSSTVERAIWVPYGVVATALAVLVAAGPVAATGAQ